MRKNDEMECFVNVGQWFDRFRISYRYIEFSTFYMFLIKLVP